LLWDAARKCIDLVGSILCGEKNVGWRKHQDWKRRIKNAYIRINRIAFRGGRNRDDRLREETMSYLKLTRDLCKKLENSRSLIEAAVLKAAEKSFKLTLLNYFEDMLNKHIDLVERRLLYNETIPHEEKVFSLFEPYTEWIQKGKAGKRVELGLNVALCSDQYGFILHHRVLEKEHDVDVTVELGERLTARWDVESISYDRGFWSPGNYERLSGLVPELIMPKKGKLNRLECLREHSNRFKELRREHAGVESDINCLEHHGLDRCPDRGIDHFKSYVGLGVLAYNLHRLGNILLEKDRAKLKQRGKIKLKAA
jgi:hypothetical protein